MNRLITSLAELWRRIPKAVLFGAAVLVQCVLLVLMVADRVQDLTVTDAKGAVPLASVDDPAAPGGFPYFRHWTAQRPVSYPVTISYRSAVQPAGAPQGPPFGIRPSGGGVSGAGAVPAVSVREIAKVPRCADQSL